MKKRKSLKRVLLTQIIAFVTVIIIVITVLNAPMPLKRIFPSISCDDNRVF